MTIKATVNSIPKTRAVVTSTERSTIRTVGIGAEVPGTTLRTLEDVDAIDLVDGYVLVYSVSADAFVLEALPAIDGGSF